MLHKLTIDYWQFTTFIRKKQIVNGKWSMVNESVPQGQHFINRILQITEKKIVK